MNRREFLCASAAAAATFAGVRDLSAATYDLVVKGGRVIDPSIGLEAIRDVAIVAGKIAAHLDICWPHFIVVHSE